VIWTNQIIGTIQTHETFSKYTGISVVLKANQQYRKTRRVDNIRFKRSFIWILQICWKHS